MPTKSTQKPKKNLPPQKRFLTYDEVNCHNILAMRINNNHAHSCGSAMPRKNVKFYERGVGSFEISILDPDSVVWRCDKCSQQNMILKKMRK